MASSKGQHYAAWQGVVATVPGAKKKAPRRQVLDAASGYVSSGDGAADGLVALLGPSGSGKTTLLTLLAGHELAAEGTLMLDGRTYDEKTGASVGFVPQQDRMFATLTVGETVRLAARLRGVEDGASRVADVMRELGLEDVKDTRIGDPLASRASQRGVSGGERKRCALALELLHAPPLLVVDEPTSGLDSRGAVGVMRVLATLAAKQAVICSLHQPSARALGFVRQLGLLSPGGRTLYWGPADAAPAHFKRLGQPVPPLTNAAEHYLELIGDTDDNELKRTLIDAADAAATGAATTAALLRRPARGVGSPARGGRSAGSGGSPAAGGIGFVAEVRALLWRAHTHNMRNPAFLRAMVSRSLTMAIVIGYLYSGLGSSQRSVQDRAGALYFVLTNQVMSSSASLRTFIAEREIVAHERRAGLFSTRAYFVARSAAEALLQLLGAVAFGALAYWLVGLAPSAAQVGVFLAVVGAVTLVAESHVVLVGAAMPDERSAAVMSPLVLALFLVSGGLFVNAASLPPLFVWLNKINVFTYGFSALLHNEFEGLAFTCEPAELVGKRCPVERGEQVIASMAPNQLPPMHNLAVLVAMLVGYRLLGFYALSKRLRSPLKR